MRRSGGGFLGIAGRRIMDRSFCGVVERVALEVGGLPRCASEGSRGGGRGFRGEVSRATAG